MSQYLLFRLYGPIASWGDIAVGEYRPTFDHPSKSAIIGLLCAAQGIRRDEEEKIRGVSESYHVAIKTESPGILLRDFHTIQTVKLKKNMACFSRKQEFERAHDLNTILSSRDYYCEASYVVCIFPAKSQPFLSLVELNDKLNKPIFILYLGRKSCPVSLPLEPQIINDANNLKEAFEKAKFSDYGIGFGDWLKKDSRATPLVCFDPGTGTGFENSELQTIVRRDVPLSRKRWQFEERTETTATFKEEG